MADRAAGAGTMSAWRGPVLLAVALLAPLGARSAPPDPERYRFIERPGMPLPARLPLRESDGRTVNLGEIAQGKPLILVLGYFRCANLCGIVRASLFRALSAANLQAGRDYVLALLSIDPQEMSAEARAAKAEDVAAFRVANPQFVHYLTGTAPEIEAITAAAGFRDRYDAPSKQFVHPVGIVFATSEAVVSNYLLGVGYTPAAVRSAVQHAGAGAVAAVGAPLLLVCFHFDPTTGRYSLEVLKVLRLAGFLTVLTLAGMLFLLHRRPRASA
jgi:protein SCO1/2